MSSSGVVVEVERQGKRFSAQASFDCAAPLELVWSTLTDYPALPQFMPGVRACRVLERQAGGRGLERLLVEQQGEFRFLLFAQALTVTLEITHERQRVAAARATRFDLGRFSARALDAFEARYQLHSARGVVKVHYSAQIVSRFAPPPGIGSTAVRLNLATQLNAIAGEIARREQLRAAAAA